MGLSTTSVGKKMMRISLMHRITIEKATIEKGLYFGQFPVLDFVTKNNGCTQAQLAQHMQVSAPSVARSVARMERAGLIERVGDENDRRCNQLSVTEKGIKTANICRAHIEALNSKMLEGFSCEEIDALGAYLDRMIENLSTDTLKDNNMFSLVAQAMELHKSKEPKHKETD